MVQFMAQVDGFVLWCDQASAILGVSYPYSESFYMENLTKLPFVHRKIVKLNEITIC